MAPSPDTGLPAGQEQVDRLPVSANDSQPQRIQNKPEPNGAIAPQPQDTSAAQPANQTDPNKKIKPAEPIKEASLATDDATPEPKQIDVANQPSSADPTASKPAAGKPAVVDAIDQKKPTKYTEHLQLGMKQYKTGRFRKAIRNFNKAISVDAKGVDAMVALANSYFEIGKDAKAIAMAKQAVKIDPQNAKAHLTLGTIYQTGGKNKLAKEAYQSYLKLDPDGVSSAEVRAILENL